MHVKVALVLGSQKVAARIERAVTHNNRSSDWKHVPHGWFGQGSTTQDAEQQAVFSAGGQILCASSAVALEDAVLQVDGQVLHLR